MQENKSKKKVSTKGLSCGVKDCEEAGRILYQNVWFCKKHGEDYANIDYYVKKYYELRRKLKFNQRGDKT